MPAAIEAAIQKLRAMKTIIHRRCGKVAFYYSGQTDDGLMEPQWATLVDGSKPERHTHIRCGSCNEIVAGRPDLIVPGELPE